MTAALERPVAWLVLFAHPRVRAATNTGWGAIDRAFRWCRAFGTDFLSFDDARDIERRKRVWEHLASEAGGAWVTIEEGGYRVCDVEAWMHSLLEAEERVLRVAGGGVEQPDARLSDRQRQQRREAGIASAAERRRRAVEGSDPTDAATEGQRSGNGDPNGAATGRSTEPPQGPSSGVSPSLLRDSENPELRGGDPDQPAARAGDGGSTDGGTETPTERATEPVDVEPPPPRESGVFGAAPALTLVTVDLELPAELASAAREIGLRDVDGAWAKFKAHRAGQRVPLQRAWTKWFVDEKRYEARDSGKPGPNGPRPGPARASPCVQPVPETGRLWQGRVAR